MLVIFNGKYTIHKLFLHSTSALKRIQQLLIRILLSYCRPMDVKYTCNFIWIRLDYLITNFCLGGGAVRIKITTQQQCLTWLASLTITPHILVDCFHNLSTLNDLFNLKFCIGHPVRIKLTNSQPDKPC